MKKFVTTRYTIQSDKIKHPLKLVMISDLHNVVLGEKNDTVFSEIRRNRPDAILIAGDLILGRQNVSLKPAEQFLMEIVKLAPVIYAPGNHEQRMKLSPDIYGQDFSVFEKKMKEMGIIYLENQSVQYEWKGGRCVIHGLDVPPAFYERGIGKKLETEIVEKLLGKTDRENFHILLAHTPRYGKTYFEWGADLILSGHYHGGIMRIPGLGAVIGPDLCVFPKYGYGMKQKGQQYMITGAGLGEHTIPLRINNPRELVVIRCLPKER